MTEKAEGIEENVNVFRKFVGDSFMNYVELHFNRGGLDGLQRALEPQSREKLAAYLSANYNAVRQQGWPRFGEVVHTTINNLTVHLLELLDDPSSNAYPLSLKELGVSPLAIVTHIMTAIRNPFPFYP
ncbi:MAG TPA: hypothetical protein VLA77_04775 [Candidatus Saccharimonadales bacterium]|nr:hypothetical protein [Candidatus Saccharimonadales bacterium]